MWLEPEGREGFFTGLMRERAALSGFAPDFGAAKSDAPDLFLTLWRAPGRAPILAAASLSRRPLEAGVSMDVSLANPRVRYGSEGVAVAADAAGIRVSLPSGGYALIEGPGWSRCRFIGSGKTGIHCQEDL